MDRSLGRARARAFEVVEFASAGLAFHSREGRPGAGCFAEWILGEAAARQRRELLRETRA
jgi:hypothetical protein